MKPVYVSVGHRIALRSAERVVLETCTRYRLPEPIRHADRLSREAAGRGVRRRAVDLKSPTPARDDLRGRCGNSVKRPAAAGVAGGPGDG